MNELDAQLDEILDGKFEVKLDELLQLSAKTTTPGEKSALKNLLKHYAKKQHPFRECVRDNRKRFGPGAEAVCATLKDIIRGTTKWRGNPERDHGSTVGYSEDVPELTERLAEIVTELSELDLWELLELAAVDELPTFAERNEFKNRFPNAGVSLKRDKNGLYVHTHRARSKSYRDVVSIPKADVDYIESTG